MSQKRKDKARGSKDVDEKESATASSNRSSTYSCDECKKELDEKQVACAFRRNSDRHYYCQKCFQEILEESKEIRAKRRGEGCEHEKE